MPHKLSSVVQEPHTQKQGSDAGKNTWLAARDCEQTNGRQGLERQYGLQSHETNSCVGGGHQAISRAIVILPINPSDGHEVWELPNENHGVECPCLAAQLTRCCSPAN